MKYSKTKHCLTLAIDQWSRHKTELCQASALLWQPKLPQEVLPHSTDPLQTQCDIIVSFRALSSKTWLWHRAMLARSCQCAEWPLVAVCDNKGTAGTIGQPEENMPFLSCKTHCFLFLCAATNSPYPHQVMQTHLHASSLLLLAYIVINSSTQSAL